MRKISVFLSSIASLFFCVAYASSEEVSCTHDMVKVVGDALDSSTDYGEALQDMSCINWISQDFPARCEEFSKRRWEQLKTKLTKKRLEFCIDKYEWPNKAGESPTIFVDWREARDACDSVGKRLCTEEEWTFACEGEEGLPYPNGYVREETSCNIDKPWIPPDLSKLFYPTSKKFREEELARLWQGVKSGESEKCVSPFGVHDMTGNVDEWTESTRKTGHRSIFKGGYWGKVRDRCRPSTRLHNELHKHYQSGFRCCSG